MVGFVIIGGLFLTLIFWILEGVYQKIKSKDPKGNYQKFTELEELEKQCFKKALERSRFKKGHVMWRLLNEDLQLLIQEKDKLKTQLK